MKVVIDKNFGHDESWSHRSVRWNAGDAHDLRRFFFSFGKVILLLRLSESPQWHRENITGGNISYTNVQTKEMAKIFTCKHFAILQPWES